MYLEHFGLREYPFSITPDTDYFFRSRSSQEALNTLLIAAKTGEGFLKITGEVGTGKTILCRKLMAGLEPEFVVAFIPNPYLQPDALFIALASELGIPFNPNTSPNQPVLIGALTNKLLEINREGRRVAVCLDEAQAMPAETLEALRLLTNLETEKRKLIQVIIFGQPELEEKLNLPSIRQLKQRITFHYALRPLAQEEVGQYLVHRLAIAGHTGQPLLTRPALWLLKSRTKCVPRLVNVIAHKSLMSAFGKGKKLVTFSDVMAAVRDTPSVAGGLWPLWGLSGLVLTLVLLVSFLLMKGS
jgi:MSHA biogenesis protein MshM